MEFIKSLIPSSDGFLFGVGAVFAGTILDRMLGGFDTLFEFLIVAMTIDYITGILAAYIHPEEKLSSGKGFKGFLKKLVIVCLVVLGQYIDLALSQHVVRNATCWFFVGNEGLSILENAGKAGVPIPRKLRDSLKVLSKGGNGGVR